MPTEVSGRAFLGLINHVREQHGAAALEQTLARAAPSTRAVFERRILHANWYPYAAYVDFLSCLDARFGKGDGSYCRELGRSSGVRDINTVFRIYLAIASTERLIRGCSRVWESYYREAGQMTALRWAPEDTRLRITDFPGMARVHCLLMEGWMEATMASIGIEVLDGRESACTSRGDAAHEFACRWRKR